jgi:hypothetical protein
MFKRYLRLVAIPSLLVSSCAEPNNLNANNVDAVAQDYCAEIIPYLVELDSTVTETMRDDRFDPLPELEIIAGNLTLVVIRAENDGLDLATLEAGWLLDLKNASRALRTVIHDEADYLTDDELRQLLGRILQDFEASPQKCVSKKA